MADFNERYRLAAGSLTSTAILAGTQYLVSNFPSDGAAPWMVDAYNVVTPYVERELTLSNVYKRQGYPNFAWDVQVADATMFNYLYGTIFGSADSASVTAVTRDLTAGAGTAAQWVAVNCKAVLPEFRPDALEVLSGQTFFTIRVQFYEVAYAGTV